MKMYVIKNDEGKFLSKSKFRHDAWRDNAWDATLFRRKCDASNSMNYRKQRHCEVVEVEVRVKV